MAESRKKTSEPAAAQVFELTMDNDEDQEELNRRLRKPGEPEARPSVKPVTADSPTAVPQGQAGSKPLTVDPA